MAAANNFELTLESVTQAFMKEFGLEEAHCKMAKQEFADALDTGSDQHKREKINEVFSEYKDIGYLLISSLGSGAFGSVYKGMNLKTKEILAIKVIDLEESKDDIQTICREIKALSSARLCPQLVRYKGSCINGTNLWILMEHVEGGSIHEIMRARNGLEEKHCAIIAREILLGLHYLSTEQRFHRDIKAANILLQYDGQVKLADLGASGQLTVTSPQTNTVVGSPYWMAPEVFIADKYDGSADIWSLGITLIEITNCYPPYANLPPMQAVQKVVSMPPPKLDGKFSEQFQDFVAKCLQKDPKDRPTIKQLLKHIFVKKAGGNKSLKELLK